MVMRTKCQDEDYRCRATMTRRQRPGVLRLGDHYAASDAGVPLFCTTMWRQMQRSSSKVMTTRPQTQGKSSCSTTVRCQRYGYSCWATMTRRRTKEDSFKARRGGSSKAMWADSKSRASAYLWLVCLRAPEEKEGSCPTSFIGQCGHLRQENNQRVRL